MGKIIGVGAIKDNESKDIKILNEQIEKMRDELSVMTAEKKDLEKLPVTLSGKIKELEKELTKVTDQKEKAEIKIKELETELTNLKKSLKEAGK